MFNFFNPQMPGNPMDFAKMFEFPAVPQQTPAYAQLSSMGNAFQSFWETLSSGGPAGLDSSHFEQLMNACSLGAQMFGANPAQTPPWPAQTAMPALAPAVFGDNVPALGPGREWQEDFSTLARLQADLLTCQREFLGLFSSFPQNAGERLQKALKDRRPEDLTFDLLSHIWIDCCEEEFQEVSTADDFAHRYAAVINASMRLRKHGDAMLEKRQRLANMPSRAEIDDLHERLAAAKDRELSMVARMEQMERELRSLRASVAKKTPARKPAAKTSRKTPAKKRS